MLAVWPMPKTDLFHAPVDGSFAMDVIFRILLFQRLVHPASTIGILDGEIGESILDR